MDRLTPEQRSWNMSRVRSRNTAPEVVVRKLLHRAGYRFRLHRADLPGSPDIVLPKYRLVIFVHGCFWHGHADCSRARLPATRAEFWEAKIRRNRQRDEAAVEELTKMGYRVVTVWECELRDGNRALAKVGALTGRGEDRCQDSLDSQRS